MAKINFTELINTDFNLLKNNLESYLNVTHLQTYFPILLNYLEEETDLHNNVLKNKYFINTINTIKNDIIEDYESNKSNIEINKKDPYIKTFVEAQLFNQHTNNKVTRNVFIKTTPIIDIIPYILDEYDVTHSVLLPNMYQNNLNKKINNYQNTAYIDAFFSYLSSKLTESGKCPCFPLFYGTFTAISSNYKFDITEDYADLKYHNKYQTNINKLFTILECPIDMSEKSLSNTSSIQLQELNEIIELGDNITDISNILDDNLFETHLNNNIKSPNICSDTSQLDGIVSIDENYIFENISDDYDTFKYCCLKNIPIQLICMEALEETLDDLIENDTYTIDNIEWLSILFQICFGLAVAQKHYSFVHNDLHSSNIMFKKTESKYLYFNYENTVFKIPTFNKIVKIIDFGRATFNHNDTIFFSDVFDINGDAEGQYCYPENNSFKNCNIKPNYSFDLARLSSTIIEHFTNGGEIFKLLKTWITDKHGYCLINDEDDFYLYKNIAKNVNNAVPKKQLKKKIFKKFVNKNKIPPNTYIYNY